MIPRDTRAAPNANEPQWLEIATAAFLTGFFFACGVIGFVGVIVL